MWNATRNESHILRTVSLTTDDQLTCASFATFKTFLGIFANIYSEVGKTEPTLANFYEFGQIFIVTNCQLLKDNLGIWSHCPPIVLIYFSAKMEGAKKDKSQRRRIQKLLSH